MILQPEDLDNLSELMTDTNASLSDAIVSNIKIDYVDYPVIDHHSKAPFIELPDIKFNVEFSLLYVYVDMQKKGLNIDNPQFISENTIKEYLIDNYFEFTGDNIITLRIKEMVYDDFNIDFHASKNTPSGKEILCEFNSYCVWRKSFKINIVDSKVVMTGILTIYADYRC